MQVRQAQLADAADIASIHIRAWQAAYQGVMPADFLAAQRHDEKTEMWQKVITAGGKGINLVALLSGNIEGFGVYGPARDDDLQEQAAGELVALNVNPEKWRCNVGSAILSEVITGCIDRHWSSLHLWVVSSNVRAIHFYEKFGFASENIHKEDKTHAQYPVKETRFFLELTDSKA
ncbi:MAG: GNAT family N-acetyltransferase [Arenicella sp.]